MREIRFRMYDKTDRKMITEGFVIDCKGGIPASSVDEWGHNFVLMQYTGLKDKNGKEIYEGDIVKGFWGLTVSVKWDYLFLGQMGKEQVEVIGNIYENPELLK